MQHNANLLALLAVFVSLGASLLAANGISKRINLKSHPELGKP